MSRQITDQMVEGSGEIDLEQAMLDPGSVFASPEALRDQPSLTQEPKIEILRRWAYDAKQLAVAEYQGMMGGKTSPLAGVLSMLDFLTGRCNTEHSPPKLREVA